MTPQFTLYIDTGGDAFEGGDAELGRVLRRAAERIEASGVPDEGIPLLDMNGNVVGRAYWVPVRDADALDLIRDQLDGRAWTPDDLDAVAEIVRRTGRPIWDVQP